MLWKRLLLAVGAGALGLVPAISAAGQGQDPAAATRTATPIKHLVVIFQENISFDHYFATYPVAANPKGEPAFHARPGTPTVNGLSNALLTSNPNLGNPQRLDRSQALTCDQGHGYTAEQSAFDGGAMDLFVQDTGKGLTLGQCLQKELGTPQPATPGNFAVLDYYDGNTTTAMWNYAQHFAMSDNSYSNTFGPSTPGAFNVIAGNTFGATCGPSFAVFGSTACASGIGQSGPAVAQGAGTNYSDADPLFDACSRGSTIAMGGKNIGDQLNSAGVTWGFFEGGFRPTGVDAQGNTTCPSAHNNIGGASIPDYIPHHQPFQYYPQTANPQHLPPTSVAAIGHQDRANHQYDLSDFFAAADKGNLPQVSYLKAAAFQDGHAGYSDPLDEQTFLVDTINRLERLPTWQSTAVVIAYDDSDGWYDHQMGPIIDQSGTSLDALTGAGMCGSNASKTAVLFGQQARCGVGPRQPLLVISPFSRENFVDNTLTEQSSVVRFIEDNWRLGRIGGGSFDSISGSLNGMFDFSRPQAGRLLLDPATGRPVGRDGED